MASGVSGVLSGLVGGKRERWTGRLCGANDLKRKGESQGKERKRESSLSCKVENLIFLVHGSRA